MSVVSLFKHVDRAVCYTCGQEWFGRDGDIQAQGHADDTGHNVVVTVTTRQTFNGELIGDHIPQPTVLPAPLQVTTEPVEQTTATRPPQPPSSRHRGSPLVAERPMPAPIASRMPRFIAPSTGRRRDGSAP